MTQVSQVTCRSSPFLWPSSCRNSLQAWYSSQMEPWEIFLQTGGGAQLEPCELYCVHLKAMAVSVVVRDQPSITFACLSHLSD